MYISYEKNLIPPLNLTLLVYFLNYIHKKFTTALFIIVNIWKPKNDQSILYNCDGILYRCQKASYKDHTATWKKIYYITLSKPFDPEIPFFWKYALWN